MAREVTIVDAGLGNLASVERALIQVGAAVRVSGDPDKVATARVVVFPGQGAFGATTQSIVDGALGAALRMVIDRGDPFLGICLGMQLLFDGSDENGGHEGLAILPGRCRRLPVGVDEEAEPGAAMPAEPIRAVEPRASQREHMSQNIAAELEGEPEPEPIARSSGDDDGSSRDEAASAEMPMPVVDAPAPVPTPVPPVVEPPVIAPAPAVVAAPVAEVDPDAPVTPLMRRVKVPHVGWNSVEPTGEHYYFVHSYYVEPARSEDIMWVASYGGIRFPAAVRYQNVLGCQFHPEKSQRSGLKFLRAFLLGGWG